MFEHKSRCQDLRSPAGAAWRGWYGPAMEVLETVTFLEMTSPRQLRPGRPAPALALERADEASAPLLRSTYERVGAPFDWQGRRTGADVWSVERWAARLSQPGVQAWLARVGGEVAGMFELEARPQGEVEIVVFGLVPEFVGKGLGAHLLTLATELAWNAEPLDAPVRRVWLHTSSRDHPNARPNYERRGFRPFRTERRRREILR
jgi:GNAT superfamily N-acetyltransferase